MFRYSSGRFARHVVLFNRLIYKLLTARTNSVPFAVTQNIYRNLSVEASECYLLFIQFYTIFRVHLDYLDE